MKILSLDSTTREGSIALLDDDRVVSERRGDASRTHAERLPADVVALLHEHHLELADIDLFAVASGPGSFTGLRVGIATMQGFASVRHRPLIGISALDALAHAGSLELAAAVRIGAWMDAHRRDVFSALYEVTGHQPFDADRLRPIEEPRVDDPAATLTRWRTLPPWPAVFIGDGAAMYADAIRHHATGAHIVCSPALASTIGRLARRRAQAGTATGVQPLYVRRPDAELARDSARAMGTPKAIDVARRREKSWPGRSKP